MSRPSLLERTLFLLHQSDQPLHKMAEESGLGYAWLWQLQRGRFKSPGVNKIEALHEYLLRQKEKKEKNGNIDAA